MQFKFFSIPAASPEPNEGELNKFLRSHRVLNVDRHFQADKDYWAVAVEYVDQPPTAEAPPQHRKEKTDVTIGMNDEEKARYEHFTEIRRQLSKANNIPAYLVFTNEELAKLAKVSELDASTVRTVKGIAPSRLKDFVHHFYVVTDGEENGQPHAADSQSGKPS